MGLSAAERRHLVRAVVLTVDAAALTVLAAGLVCTALRDDDHPCAGGCGLSAFRDERACANAPISIPHELELYAAVIDTVYRPLDYASALQHPFGILLLQVQSAGGAAYLSEPAVRAQLGAAVAPHSVDSLLSRFRNANASAERLDGVIGGAGSLSSRFNVRYLDSATVRRVLYASPDEALKESLVADLLAGAPLDSLPGILALSIPGTSADGDTALMFASLHDRRSREPDHLEAAAFLIMRRDGFRWRIAAEVPIARPRRP